MFADALKMILAMALFFGAMYLYSWMPDILEARREKKREKLRLQKLANRETQILELQKLREEKFQTVKERRAKIKEHFEWLERMNKKIDQQAADNIRALAVAMVEKANSGHPGGPMGGGDFMHILYSEFFNYDPTDMEWIKDNMDKIPVGSKIFVVLAHFVGIITGMFVAAKISKTNMIPSYIVGAFMILATLFTIFMS